jgi:hypothetical protein
MRIEQIDKIVILIKELLLDDDVIGIVVDVFTELFDS